MELITMIYLIGGPPRGGKTILAEALAKRTSFPYFTLDHVTSVIAPYISDYEYVTRLPLRVARQETNYSNDVFYAKYSAEQIVDFYLCQAGTYWPGVESFIRYAIEDDHDLILEGWQILPHLLHAVITPNQGKSKTIFLYKLDMENIVSGLKATTARNDWVIKNTKDESTFLAIAKMINHFGSYIEKEANEYNFRSVNTDFDFAEKIRESVLSLSI
jgi:2-phosphoglycerate kinase